MDLSFDRGLKMAHAEKSLTKFWCDVEKKYPELGKRALNELLPFGSTYMCEVTFSAVTHIKTKQSKRLNVENSLVSCCPQNYQSLWKKNKLKCLNIIFSLTISVNVFVLKGSRSNDFHLISC